jgi:MinD-like ATPase involved in chromosome partitioning or flagellar assembly
MMPPMPTFADTAAGGGIGDSVAMVAERLISMRSKRVMVVTTGDEVGDCRPLAAVALARALGRADRRPVLIDLRDDDADSLSMGDASGLRGFSDLFAGVASFGQVIFRDRKSRVHFIPAGLRRFSRQDLADERVALLVNALDHTYDHVVFDVAGDFLEAIGSECDAAVVATEFDRDDPRTVHLIELVRVHSQARIVVCRIDPVEAGEMSGLAVERAVADAAA